MDFMLCKLEQTLRSLEQCAVARIQSVEERFTAPDPLERHVPEAFLDACEHLTFVPFGVHERWGEVNESRVFRLDVEVGAEFAGKPLYLKITTGREGGYTAFNPQFLAYVDGRLIQGMDINHTLLKLHDAPVVGQRIRVLIHAFAGTEPGLMEFKTELRALHAPVLNLAYAYRTALQAMLTLPEENGERAELCEALLNVADVLAFHESPGAAFMKSVETAQERLDYLVYNRQWAKSPVQVHCIGHTHIDIAWRWTVEQSRQKVQRSFKTVVSLMKRYPDYKFFSSQPILCDFVKQDNPELYDEIKALIREGRWEAEGGMWLESDCNLPCGESFVRQILYGKRFLKEEFDVDSQILWMPDSFGYSAVLPQLMKKSGLKYFVSSKLSWNEFNRVPHDVFTWEGMDGSEVLACMITTPDDEGLPNSPDFSTYNATLQPKNVLGAWQRRMDKDVTRHVIMPYGFGDGGGGPTEEMLESASYMAKGLPGIPQMRLGRADAFFAQLSVDAAQCRKLPRFADELYLEFHRGTYTSVAKIKRDNRRAEQRMLAAELLAALAPDPDFDREAVWKKIMLNQFHDVLPGSAIEAVYRQCDEDYRAVFSACDRAIEKGLRAVTGRGDEALCVVNPTWTHQPRILLLEGMKGRAPMRNGRLLPSQELSDGRVAVYVEDLPTVGVETFALAPMDAPVTGSMIATRDLLENRFFRLEFNAAGQIIRLFDKRAGREVLKPDTVGNAILAYEDRPASCDAWNIDVNYVEKEYPVDGPAKVEAVENGAVCAAVCVTREFMHSRMTQTIRLYRDLPRIDFETEVDWHERQIALKAEFPVDVHAREAVCGIQYGSVRRPVRANTAWDAARFEVYAHDYVDLSEGNYGVSLFTGDKYGVDVMEGKLRLTLLKAPIEPWKGADDGLHRFTYSLYPHEGDCLSGGVYGAAISDRIIAGVHADVAANVRYSLVNCDAETVSVEAVKPAEDGQGMIIRLCEFGNRRVNAGLMMPDMKGEAWLCDLMEKPICPLSCEAGRIEIPMKPCEVQTVRIKCGLQ